MVPSPKVSQGGRVIALLATGSRLSDLAAGWLRRIVERQGITDLVLVDCPDAEAWAGEASGARISSAQGQDPATLARAVHQAGGRLCLYAPGAPRAITEAARAADLAALPVVPHVSPSQIDTRRGCARKHAYDRQRPYRQHPSAAAGDRVHRVLESWLQDRIVPNPATPEGRCALTGIHHLPQPGQVLVEHAIRTDLGTPPAAYSMRLDMLYGYAPGRVVVVGDHKSTGDISRLAKRVAHEDPSQDFVTDTQRIIYCHWAAEALQVPSVIAHWEYYQRDAKRDALAVVYQEDRETLRERFDHLHTRYSLPIIQDHGSRPEEHPRNLAYCRRYGRCQHMDECHADIPTHTAAAVLLR